MCDHYLDSTSKNVLLGCNVLLISQKYIFGKLQNFNADGIVKTIIVSTLISWLIIISCLGRKISSLLGNTC